MNIIQSGMSTISANGANIIARYEDAELVAVLHTSGYVALYAEDDDELMQVSAMMKSETNTPAQIANKLMGL